MAEQAMNYEDMLLTIKKGPIPAHVAIIMDGNGRWAKAKGLLRLAGHRAGVEVIDDILTCIKTLGIKYFTIFAFSTENWKRPSDEVDGLMRLLIEYIDREIDKLDQEGVCFRTIGATSALDKKVRKKLDYAIERTKNNDDVIFNIALNYGGRQEILMATKEIAKGCMDGRYDPEEITEGIFSQHLYTSGQADPDLLIRTSGEFRISNFLLWQIAYTEIWITDVLWPDFKKEHLLEAICSYQKRDRRFGGLTK